MSCNVEKKVLNSYYIPLYVQQSVYSLERHYTKQSAVETQTSCDFCCLLPFHNKNLDFKKANCSNCKTINNQGVEEKSRPINMTIFGLKIGLRTWPVAVGNQKERYAYAEFKEITLVNQLLPDANIHFTRCGYKCHREVFGVAVVATPIANS